MTNFAGLLPRQFCPNIKGNVDIYRINPVKCPRDVAFNEKGMSFRIYTEVNQPLQNTPNEKY